MNKGSKRVTIRIGDDLLDRVQDDIQVSVNANNGEITNVTDWIIAAITDRLSHRKRSRKIRERVIAEKIDEYRPRDVRDAEY